MAYAAGAGSIITLLGAARGPVAMGFYNTFTGKTISFFEYTYYFMPVGWIMVFAIWGMMMVFFKPEKDSIPGLKEKAKTLYAELGSFSSKEITAALIILSAVVVLGGQSFSKDLASLNKSAIMLITTLLFYILNILTIEDLEGTPSF